METRRVKRINIELKGKFEFPQETDKKIGILKKVIFKTHDISPSGALLLTTHYLPKGIEVGLLFSENRRKNLPRIKISSEVAYCKFITIRKYKLGVRFKNLKEEKKKYIRRLLDIGRVG